ncbi:MAG: hypothetical protein ACPGOY_01745 [Rhodospirillaceae bacterium]
MRLVISLAALAILTLISAPTTPWAAEQTKTIQLITTGGEAFPIGSLTAPFDGSAGPYTLTIDHHQGFQDYFLSMKEMKCLEGPELWCHLPYPYPSGKTLSGSDLRWLEHDLIFLFKTPGEYGANLWNGIYYKMALDPETGVITGEARAVDLNLLASPHDDLSQPALGEYDLEDFDASARWLPKLEIR